MSPLLLICVAFLLGSTSCAARHVININSTTPVEFSSLAWDPIVRHFLVGSSKGPVVYAIPDAGVVKCPISEPFPNSSGVSVSDLVVDHARHQLIVAFSSSPPYVVVYDMESYMRIFAIPLPELDGAPGGVAVDEKSGEVFVSSVKKGVILKVGSETKRQKVISDFEISSDQGLGGLVHTGQGYIIVVQPSTGKIFKVNSKDGTSREVLSVDDSANPLAPEARAIVLSTDFSIVAATNRTLVTIKSDNTWEHAKAAHELILHKRDGVVAVSRRDTATYVLAMSHDGVKIEEAVLPESEWRAYVTFGFMAYSFLVTLFIADWHIRWDANVPIGR